VAECVARRRRLGELAYRSGKQRWRTVSSIMRTPTFPHIVVSTRRRSRWSELLRSSSAHEIIRRVGDISVHRAGIARK